MEQSQEEPTKIYAELPTAPVLKSQAGLGVRSIAQEGSL